MPGRWPIRRSAPQPLTTGRHHRPSPGPCPSQDFRVFSVTCPWPRSCAMPCSITPSNSGSLGTTYSAERPGGRCSAATTTTARSGSLLWPPPGFCLTPRFTICGTPSPARPWPGESLSPKYPAGSDTSRSPRPSTCTATWSPRPAAGPATHSTGHSPRSADVPPMCPGHPLSRVPPQVTGTDGG